VITLHWHADKGTLTSIQSISLIPPDYHGPTSTGDDIVVDRTGRFAYATNRGYDCLCSFSIDPKDGKLTLLARGSCGGKVPRHLALDPTEKWILIANQESDNITVLARDPKTGKVAETGKNFPLAKPQCLVFA